MKEFWKKLIKYEIITFLVLLLFFVLGFFIYENQQTNKYFDLQKGCELYFGNASYKWTQDSNNSMRLIDCNVTSAFK